jgi:hypothetical protein
MSNKQTQLAGWMTWTDSDGNAMAGPESVYRLYVQSVTDTMEISQLQTIQDAMEKLGENIPHQTGIALQVISETILQKRQDAYFETLERLMMQAGV